MGLIERAGIRAANGSCKQRIDDETDALGLGSHSIENPAGGMARRSHAVYAQAPDRDRLTIFRLLQLCTGWPPAEEIDILRSEIHRRLTKLQNLVNPVGMICMAVRQTNPHQAQSVRGQELDHRRRIVRRVDEHRLPAVMNHIALHSIAVDRPLYPLHAGRRRLRNWLPLLDRDLLQRSEEHTSELQSPDHLV